MPLEFSPMNIDKTIFERRIGVVIFCLVDSKKKKKSNKEIRARRGKLGYRGE